MNTQGDIILYKSGLVTVRRLTEAEREEYLKLTPGIYITADKIQQVAVENGEMRIFEYTADGINRIRMNL